MLTQQEESTVVRVLPRLLFISITSQINTEDLVRSDGFIFLAPALAFLSLSRSPFSLWLALSRALLPLWLALSSSVSLCLAPSLAL